MRAKIVGDARKLLLFTMVPAAALAAGCADSSAPNQAPAAAIAATAQVQAKPGRGIDAEFTRLAKEIPGFGGMYYDKSGRLTVQVVKPQAGAAARSPDVVGRLRSVGGATVQRRLAQSGTAIVREAKYDYGQLQSWKGNLSKIFGVRGVVYTDTDEEQNRVRIGITPGASQRDVERALARAGVPREAVVFSRTSAIKRVQTLQDRLRPVPGGAQLVFPARSEGPGAFFVCTLGFNARLPGQSRDFFVTASHCSDIQGGDQNTPYFQPTPFVSNRNNNRVAVEYKDPGYGNPGGLCYEGFRCRLSDALLARYFGSVESGFGKIARTTFGLQRIGSLIIDRNRPRWNIVGELSFPFLGEIAHKVGRTTGWTNGPVIVTCADIGVSGTDIVQICQDIVLAGSAGGDSGSGVFERVSASSSDVLLTGILWGGGDFDGAPVFVFSSMENIEHELGELTTSGGSMVASAP